MTLSLKIVFTVLFQITDVQAGSGTDEYVVSIATDNIAPFVWLEARGIRGRFSDNGFMMLAPVKTLTFYAWQNTSAADLKMALSVKSLQDVYY